MLPTSTISCAIFSTICSQVGRLRDSMSDLKSALSLQPTLSDILWHRHLLYLIQGDEQMALEDLNTLLKCNKRHFGAFRSRVTLLLRRGNTSKAVFNLTQAIALQPMDVESYFLRAELYEKVSVLGTCACTCTHVVHVHVHLHACTCICWHVHTCTCVHLYCSEVSWNLHCLTMPKSVNSSHQT